MKAFTLAFVFQMYSNIKADDVFKKIIIQVSNISKVKPTREIGNTNLALLLKASDPTDRALLLQYASHNPRYSSVLKR